MQSMESGKEFNAVDGVRKGINSVQSMESGRELIQCSRWSSLSRDRTLAKERERETERERERENKKIWNKNDC